VKQRLGNHGVGTAQNTVLFLGGRRGKRLGRPGTPGVDVGPLGSLRSRSDRRTLPAGVGVGWDIRAAFKKERAVISGGRRSARLASGVSIGGNKKERKLIGGIVVRRGGVSPQNPLSAVPGGGGGPGQGQD